MEGDEAVDVGHHSVFQNIWINLCVCVTERHRDLAFVHAGGELNCI